MELNEMMNDNTPIWQYMGTNLPIDREIGYQVDKLQYRPWDTGYDYDLRGFYNQYGTLVPKATNGHLTDEYKYPIHPTFSVESNYYNGQPYAVDWNKPIWRTLSERGLY